MSSGDTTLTITGNLTGDPELRFTATGTAVVAFTVAASRRVYDQATGHWQDGDTLFLRCSAWRELADHAAESLTKGAPRHRHRPPQAAHLRDHRRGKAHRLRGRRRRRWPLAEVGHRQDRQNRPGQGAAPRRRRPLAGPRTRRRSGHRGLGGRGSAAVLARRTTEGRTLTRAGGPHASPAPARPRARIGLRSALVTASQKGPDVRDHSEESFSDGTPLPPEEPPPGKGKGPSQAQVLVGMAEDTYRLIRSADGRAYAVPKMGPQIAVPLASKSENSLRARLAASLHRQTGQVASGSNLSDALTVLMGEASELDPRPVWLRVGQHGDTVVVDMGTETGQCLTITPSGWTVEASSPVIFRRSELTHPLVQPERGGTLDSIRALINLPEEDYRLAIAWVVAAYLTGIPHPILLVQGEQGTAKSNLIRTLLALVDPQPAAERTPPKDNREWAIFARASWAFGYDNITDIPPCSTVTVFRSVIALPLSVA